MEIETNYFRECKNPSEFFISELIQKWSRNTWNETMGFSQQFVTLRKFPNEYFSLIVTCNFFPTDSS